MLVAVSLLPTEPGSGDDPDPATVFDPLAQLATPNPAQPPVSHTSSNSPAMDQREISEGARSQPPYSPVFSPLGDPALPHAQGSYNQDVFNTSLANYSKGPDPLASKGGGIQVGDPQSDNLDYLTISGGSTPPNSPVSIPRETMLKHA